MSPAWIAVAVVIAVLVVAVCLGLLVMVRRTRAELDDARVDQVEAQAAEHQRIVALAVGAERSRILREMHDVIAHSLSIMIAQADGGSYQVSDPRAAGRALQAIADTGRAALADTRRILGVLRRSDPGEQGLSPNPAADGIDDLVIEARAAGVEAHLVRLGEPRLLPPASRLALYRICQEALTNVMKHAPGSRVVVTENWGATDVKLTITDTGGPSPRADSTDRQGLGLIGMSERVEIVGGSFEAGRMEPAGFRVRAVIPTLDADDDLLSATSRTTRTVEPVSA